MSRLVRASAEGQPSNQTAAVSGRASWGGWVILVVLFMLLIAGRMTGKNQPEPYRQAARTPAPAVQPTMAQTTSNSGSVHIFK